MLDDLAPKLDELNNTELMTMLTSLETLLEKTRECITAKAKPKDEPSPSELVDDSLFQFDDCPDIDEKLLSEVLEFVKTLKYHPSSSNPNNFLIFICSVITTMGSTNSLLMSHQHPLIKLQ